MHERADREPETVGQGKDVLEDVVVGVARVRVVPLVRTEPREDVHHQTDDEVGGDDVHPDLDGEWIEEGEETRRFALGSFEEDANAEVHERFREVDDLFADVVDRQGRYGEVGFLKE